MLIEREQYYLDNLDHSYNILQFAYSRKGLKHTKASIELMKKSHANRPVLTEQDKAINYAKRTAASHTAQTVIVTHNETGNTQVFPSIRRGADYIRVDKDLVSKHIRKHGKYTANGYTIRHK